MYKYYIAVAAVNSLFPREVALFCGGIKLKEKELESLYRVRCCRLLQNSQCVQSKLREIFDGPMHTFYLPRPRSTFMYSHSSVILHVT